MNDQPRITIDAALGGVYDRIGHYLTQAGQEDASGARRWCMGMLAAGEFDEAARWLKVDVETIRKEFGHLHDLWLECKNGGTK